MRVIAPGAVPDQALVAEAGGMGAPTVGLEKLDAFEPELALQAHMAAGGNGADVLAACSSTNRFWNG